MSFQRIAVKKLRCAHRICSNVKNHVPYSLGSCMIGIGIIGKTVVVAFLVQMWGLTRSKYTSSGSLHQFRHIAILVHTKRYVGKYEVTGRISMFPMQCNEVFKSVHEGNILANSSHNLNTHATTRTQLTRWHSMMLGFVDLHFRSKGRLDLLGLDPFTVHVHSRSAAYEAEHVDSLIFSIKPGSWFAGFIGREY